MSVNFNIIYENSCRICLEQCGIINIFQYNQKLRLSYSSIINFCTLIEVKKVRIHLITVNKN